MASTQVGKLVKRPVPAGKGYLPAAVGQLSKEPDLNLLFVVETVIGTLDPSSEFTEAKPDVQPFTPVVDAPPVSDNVREPIAQDFDEVLESVAQIEEIAEPQDVSDDIDVVTEPDVVEDVAEAFEPEPEVEPAVAVEPEDEPVVVAEAAQPDDMTDTVLPLFAQDTTDVPAPDEVIAEAPEAEEPPVTELQSIRRQGVRLRAQPKGVSLCLEDRCYRAFHLHFA